MGAAGIVALCHFVANLSLDSATVSAASGYKGMREWGEREKTNILLADLYDNITAFRYLYATSKSKRKIKRPKPYPRPWAKNDKVKHIGKDPIRVKDFAKWWKSRGK